MNRRILELEGCLLIAYLIHPRRLRLRKLWGKASVRREADQAQSYRRVQTTEPMKHPGLRYEDGSVCRERSMTLESRGFIYNDTQTGLSKRYLFLLASFQHKLYFIHKTGRRMLGAESKRSPQITSLTPEYVRAPQLLVG